MVRCLNRGRIVTSCPLVSRIESFVDLLFRAVCGNANSSLNQMPGGQKRFSHLGSLLLVVTHRLAAMEDAYKVI